VPILKRLAERPDPWLDRVAHNHVAVIHLCLGEFEAAIASAERSLGICERYGDLARVGDNLSVCGIVLIEVGQYAAAAAQFERALALHDQTQSRWSRADCLVYAGSCETFLGRTERGFAYLDESLALARDIGARYVEANAGIALAGAYLRRDQASDVQRAADAAARAAQTARDSTLVGAEIQALSRHAEALRRLGETEKALGQSTRAIELLEQQKTIEGSEEEVLFCHYRLLASRGAAGAAQLLARARGGIRRKLALLTRADWRETFHSRHREILGE
jgi:tetratricopeptide (TPR) repeat protein